MSRGAASWVVLGSIASVGMGIGIAAILQVVQAAAGFDVGTVILVGLEGVILVACGGLFVRQDRSDRNASTERKAMHEKIEAVVRAEASHYAELREQFGRLDERSQATVNTLDGLGSKIVNQMEKAFGGRMDAQDKLIESVQRVAEASLLRERADKKVV